MNHNICCEYENVTVRPLSRKDIEYLRKWRNDENNTKYLTPIGHISKEQQESWYERYLTNDDEYIFAIDENKSLNRVVGSAALYNFDGDQVEFGKIMVGDDEAHGKKVGYNAIKVLIKIAYEKFGCNKVILRCYTDNIVACNLYKKVGFSEKDRYLTVEGKEETLMEIKTTDI